MGFAMIWIVVYHLPLVFYIPVISEIKWSGYTGVDIFFLLSGLGVYFSWTKTPSTVQFYKKRVARIFTLYIPIQLLIGVILIYYLHFSPLLIMQTLIFYDFWLSVSGITPWFIPAICLMYFISPIYLKVTLPKNILQNTIIACIVSLILLALFPRFFGEMATRMPNYFIGIYMGYLIKNKVRLPLKSKVLLFLLLMIGISLICLYYTNLSFRELLPGHFIRFAVIVTTLPFCLLISSLINLIPSYKYPLLSFFGKYSLPIYLLHIPLFWILDASLHYMIPKTLIGIMSIIVSMVVSFCLQNVIYKYFKISN